MDRVDENIKNKEYKNATDKCITLNELSLGRLISYISNITLNIPEGKPVNTEVDTGITTIGATTLECNSVVNSTVQHVTKPKLRIKIFGNWCYSSDLVKLWDKMSKGSSAQGNPVWNDFQIVSEEPADYYVIVNCPPNKEEKFDKKRSIVFRMEPNMKDRSDIWGEWADPDEKEFLKVCKHENGEYNNFEWHLSKTYNELRLHTPLKNPDYNNVLSAVLGDKYKEIGQVKRVDFVKFLESKGLPVHVYGNNKWNYKDYKGSLPSHCKDDGIFPYKYHFNAENNPIFNYCTEKVLDGILGECLTFYWGCPNIHTLIDPRAYVILTLTNFEKDYQTIKKAIEEDWHTQRLPYIREAKRKILEEQQFFPRLEKILKEKKILE
jgi:hypothetical protein